jgi:hypothetical protein
VARNIFDVYRNLEWLLLRGPRDGRGAESPLHVRYGELVEPLDLDSKTRPAVGVAIKTNSDAPSHYKEFEVAIFLENELPGFLRRLVEFVDIADIPVTEIVTGPVRPTARPTMGGESIGQGISPCHSGCLACLVEDAAGEQFVLTCNHVVADVGAHSPKGDPVWQLSANDGGSLHSRIGEVFEVAPIVLGGSRPNDIDAAIVGDS